MKGTILPAGRPDSCYPLTLSRDLGACPVANRPLIEWQRDELRAAGLEVVEGLEGEEAGLVLHGNAWMDAADLASLAAEGAGTRTVDGETAAYIAGAPEGVAEVGGWRIVYPWELLEVNAHLLARLERSDYEGDVHPRVEVDGILIVGEGSRVLPGVYVEGCVIIGRECKIGPNCYLRGPTSIGDGCHIGQAVEIKASILMDKVGMGHLSYAGDSIIGTGTNFGAGTITANFRHDGRTHRSMVGGELIDTGRRKFGAIIGDNVHTGIHTSIYPGRKLWPDSSTLPGSVVQRDLMDSE